MHRINANKLLLICCLIYAAFSATIRLNATVQIAQTQSAYRFLLDDHPELISYKIVESNPLPTNDTKSQDYYFYLINNILQKEVIAIISINNGNYQAHAIQFISRSLAVNSTSKITPTLILNTFQEIKWPSSQNTSSSTNQTNRLANGTNSSKVHNNSMNQSQPKLILNSSKPLNPARNSSLGGFTPFTNYNDTLFLIAKMKVFDVFPSIIDFPITQVKVQLVAGSNFLINFQSNPFEVIQVKIYVDLHLIATIISLEIVDSIGSNTSEWSLKNLYLSLGKYFLKQEHPELNEYTEISESDSAVSGGYTFLVAYERAVDEIRALAEVRVTQFEVAILSYYTYSTQNF